MLQIGKLNFSYKDIDWQLSEEVFKEYITYAYDFFSMDNDGFYQLFNKLYEVLDSNRLTRLFFNLSFAQYVFQNTALNDRTLKTIALIGLVEEVSKIGFQGGNKLRFKSLLNKHIAFEDKKRLVKAYGFGNNFQRVCHEDCHIDDEIECLSNKCDFLTRDNIDSYVLDVLDKICKIRCSIVHESLLSLVTDVGADAYSDNGNLELYCSNISFKYFREIITSAVMEHLDSIANRTVDLQ